MVIFVPRERKPISLWYPCMQSMEVMRNACKIIVSVDAGKQIKIKVKLNNGILLEINTVPVINLLKHSIANQTIRLVHSTYSCCFSLSLLTKVIFESLILLQVKIFCFRRLTRTVDTKVLFKTFHFQIQ